MEFLILIPIIFAFISGLSISLLKNKSDKQLSNIGLLLTCLTSVITFLVMFFCKDLSFSVINFGQVMNVGFKIDGLSIIFASMVSILWIFACIYASKYMTHDGGFKRFYAFYILTFGTVLGLSFSANMLTMYIFYELLTFITLPLVMHNNKARDKFAGKKYVFYSILGASLSFMGMIVFVHEIGDWSFVQGGVTTGALSYELLISFVLMFVGFGVKSGIFPFYKWLIGAGVAPTTVTALLHAVAVVKAGAYAVIRVTYYLYDFTELRGTFAQYIVMTLSLITIFLGSSMAMKSKHLKRRLAYSTMSQLSYILLAVSTMSYIGLIAGLLHMLGHAFMKIVLFYGVGNIIFTNHKEYVKDIQGYAKKMPITFMTFTICSLSLIGVPPFIGFFSKFAIAQSLFEMQNEFTFWAVLVLVISALLTAMYLLQIIVLGYIPHNDFDEKSIENVKEAPKEMTFTLVCLTISVVAMSLGSNLVYDLVSKLILGGV